MPRLRKSVTGGDRDQHEQAGVGQGSIDISEFNRNDRIDGELMKRIGHVVTRFRWLF